MKLLTASDACRLLGARGKPMPYQTLNSIITRGHTRPPLRDANGRGQHRVFSVVDVLSIAVARGLRAHGFGWPIASQAAEAIRALTEIQLDRAFREGRTHLMVVGASVMPRLVRPDAIADATVDNRAALKAAGVAPLGLNVKVVYDRMQEELAST